MEQISKIVPILSEENNNEKENKEKIKEEIIVDKNLSICESFSQYINPQRLVSYEYILKKNIRSFHLFKNREKLEYNNLEKILKLNENPTEIIFEINFKFTCDYESIETEIKEFLDMFGEILSLFFEINSNSLKVIFKYSFSLIYITYYLTQLLNNGKIEIKEDNLMKNENKSEEKGNQDDIAQFIKILTDNYKIDKNIGNNNSENNSDIIKSNDKKEEKKDIEEFMDSFNFLRFNQEKKEENITKKLLIKQNSETPIKKDKNISNSNIYKSNNSNQKKVTPLQFYQSSLPFNKELKPPIIYVPVIPKIVTKFPFQMLVPINSPFLGKTFQRFSNSNNKIDNLIDSSDINTQKEFDNNQNDNQIKKLFDDINHIIESIDEKKHGGEGGVNELNNENIFEEDEDNRNEEDTNTSNENNISPLKNCELSNLIRINNLNKEILSSSGNQNENLNVNNLPKNSISPNQIVYSKNNLENNIFKPLTNFVMVPQYNMNLKDFKKKLSYPSPISFNKNIIDFSKLTLATKNKIHFMTHSSRNYIYKYVCNYNIQIDNDNNFMVTKRIIGKNGCFLKKILQESCIKYGDYSTKIRLRGRGSGYIDKFNKNENDDPLILSVSSLNYPTYYNCCLLVDKLLNKIYDDFYEFLHLYLPKDLHYSITKKKIVKSEFIVDRMNSIPKINNDKDK